MADANKSIVEAATKDYQTEANKPAADASLTEKAGAVASGAAAAAGTAATGVKDNVFAMFGGGQKKEKKPEPEDDEDVPSGSSKKKDAAEGEDVSLVGRYFNK